MICFINDSSLKKQFTDPQIFLTSMSELLKLRQELPILRLGLYCSRTFFTCFATPTMTMREAVESSNDRTLKRLILEWVQRSGPFWDDSREYEENDYFECNSVDVTNHGIGEAARRHLKSCAVHIFSFENGGFDVSPLDIFHGIPDNRLGCHKLDNSWTIAKLKHAALGSSPFPLNWKDFIEFAKVKCTNLILPDTLLEPLIRETYSSELAGRILELLETLHLFVGSRDANGNYTGETNRIISDHFSGSKAWFTDESTTNKSHFKGALTFQDPLNASRRIFCPWHGKVKTPQFRVHFPWPIEAGEDKLRIVYIGPKLTKE